MARILVSRQFRPFHVRLIVCLIIAATVLASFSWRTALLSPMGMPGDEMPPSPEPIEKSVDENGELAPEPEPEPEPASKITPPPLPKNTSKFKKALVMAKTFTEDTNWLFHNGFNESYGLFIYSMNDPPEPGFLLPRAHQGRESAAFLSYIVDYYDSLPTYSVFIHAGNEQRHNDLFGHLNSDLLPHLRPAAIDAAGYVNLRCALDPGCPVAVNPHDPTEEDLAKENDARSQFVDIYSELFNVPPAKVPKSIGNVCCAQFAVSKERILQRPKKDYERMMNWTANTNQTDSFSVGWIWEKLWHVVFGMETTHCPRYEQCRCDLYGWCGPLASGEILRPSDLKEL